MGFLRQKMEKQAEIVITIAKNYQKQGFGFEALEKLIDFLFNELNYHRITAIVDIDNISSLKLMQKLGMRREAYLKESYFNGSNWTDEIQFAIVEKEFVRKNDA